MSVHVAHGYEDAERWDLAYWQSRTPQERLEALAAILEDVKKVKRPGGPDNGATPCLPTVLDPGRPYEMKMSGDFEDLLGLDKLD